MSLMMSFQDILFDILGGCAREYELQEKIDDLRPAEDREAGEESHGAADQTQLCIRLDPLVPLDLVKRGRVEEDLDNLEGCVGLLDSWGGKL